METWDCKNRYKKRGGHSTRLFFDLEREIQTHIRGRYLHHLQEWNGDVQIQTHIRGRYTKRTLEYQASHFRYHEFRQYFNHLVSHATILLSNKLMYAMRLPYRSLYHHFMFFSQFLVALIVNSLNHWV